jgi:hypothetical protein
MWGCSLGAFTLLNCPHHEEDFPTCTWCSANRATTAT